QAWTTSGSKTGTQRKRKRRHGGRRAGARRGQGLQEMRGGALRGKMSGRTFGVQSLRKGWAVVRVRHGCLGRRCCCRSCRQTLNYTDGRKIKGLRAVVSAGPGGAPATGGSAPALPGRGRPRRSRRFARA